ncbi:hypothetical protein I3760_09G134500 [Carya illinoinensis]|nr:hypothetical protein I3760_09G134500 [Carya illinoinensis]
MLSSFFLSFFLSHPLPLPGQVIPFPPSVLTQISEWLDAVGTCKRLYEMNKKSYKNNFFLHKFHINLLFLK